ncbi:MAG: DUF3048 domain-containing protein, partial [Chloroflexus aggregans]
MKNRIIPIALLLSLVLIGACSSAVANEPVPSPQPTVPQFQLVTKTPTPSAVPTLPLL